MTLATHNEPLMSEKKSSLVVKRDEKSREVNVITLVVFKVTPRLVFAVDYFTEKHMLVAD